MFLMRHVPQDAFSSRFDLLSTAVHGRKQVPVTYADGEDFLKRIECVGVFLNEPFCPQVRKDLTRKAS